ncbi:terminase-like family protein [Blastomonas sp. RAC04]|uniref:terminase large subunit n=1 Tax=Blastomonas sp. RAC04 TaxID=1842535 RepID=UPI00083DA30C|nr:terminase TerL endonuclease subunit [Blastomonas sp. RAC04]AOF99371.1 terminase-like family protein [Blastomonas sp. RAC04]
MGKRGPGAGRMKEAASHASAQLVHAWQAEGLTRAERVILFIESLPVTKGFGAGEPVKLLPFQLDWLQAVYGTDDEGKRRVRTALLSMARGNGKTVLAAWLALAHLVGPEAIQRGEVYSAAATKDQSALIFAEMEATILATPWMAARLNVQRFQKRIEDDVTGSTYRALASDGAAVHGLASSFIVCDELAQWKRRELFDVLRTSMGKRAEPLLVAIGTQSPSPVNLMSELVDYSERIASGEISDLSFHGAVYAVAEDADPFDPASWQAANPALGVFVSREQIADEAERAQRMPTFEPAFLNLHCNQRVEAEPRAINPAEWNACGEAADLEALRGRRCYAGLDLASVRDLAALVLYFPDDGGAVLPFFWCPKDAIERKEEIDHVPYRAWAKAGHIEPTPGGAIDKRYIARRLATIMADFDVRGVAFDRWSMDDLKVILANEGIELPLVEWGQGFASMGPAVDAFERAMLAGELRHGMHPVLRWNASNLLLDTDPAGARKPNKARSIDRIDGMAALIMACGLASRDKGPQVYQGSGAMWL